MCPNHTLPSGSMNGLSIFFGSVVVVALVKHRARNEAVSAFTFGFLSASAANKSSVSGSRLV